MYVLVYVAQLIALGGWVRMGNKGNTLDRMGLRCAEESCETTPVWLTEEVGTVLGNKGYLTDKIIVRYLFIITYEYI